MKKWAEKVKKRKYTPTGFMSHTEKVTAGQQHPNKSEVNMCPFASRAFQLQLYVIFLFL